ncbi:hypothetical protein SNEBB_010820 [Seison nebaliae]|nr:hypothetical protein SNEBB_010820 [Seison nebaliae]
MIALQNDKDHVKKKNKNFDKKREWSTAFNEEKFCLYDESFNNSNRKSRLSECDFNNTSVPLSSPHSPKTHLGKQDKLSKENLSNLSNSPLVRNSSNGFDLIPSKLDETNSLLRQLIKNNQNPIIDPEDQKFFNELLGIDFHGDHDSRAINCYPDMWQLVKKSNT